MNRRGSVATCWSLRSVTDFRKSRTAGTNITDIHRMTALFEIAPFDGFWQCQAPPTKTLAATDLATAGETQPEVAQASPNDEADPAHPHWCSPATDNDWPTHVNPQEMEESHQRKNHAGHHIECSLIHGPILQGFHHNNNGKRHEAVHLIPRNWPVAAPVAWRRPAQGFGLLGAVCTNSASALLRSRAWMTLNIVGTRNSVAPVAKSRPPITAFTREPRAGALHHSPRQRNGAPLSDRYARA